jgi:hypothetical protein
VLRAVARLCISRARDIERSHPHPHYLRWTRDAEYSAEIWIVARRQLNAKQWIIYREYLINDRPWAEVDKHVRHGRGNFFHEVYRTEEKLGAALIGSPMFPPATYFAGLSRRTPDEGSRGRHIPASPKGTGEGFGMRSLLAVRDGEVAKDEGGRNPWRNWLPGSRKVA